MASNNDIAHIAFSSAQDKCNHRSAVPDPRTVTTIRKKLQQFTFYVALKDQPSTQTVREASASKADEPAKRIPFRVALLSGQPTPGDVESFYLGVPGTEVEIQKQAWLAEPATGPASIMAEAASSSRPATVRHASAARDEPGQ